MTDKRFGPMDFDAQGRLLVTGQTGSAGPTGAQGPTGHQGATGAGTPATVYTQATHGFTIGDAVRFDGDTSAWVKSEADTADHSEVFGLVDTMPTLGSFTLATDGQTITGLSSLTPGAIYVLSQTVAGALVATTYTSGIIAPCLLATSATAGIVQIQRAPVGVGGIDQWTALVLHGDSIVDSSAFFGACGRPGIQNNAVTVGNAASPFTSGKSLLFQAVSGSNLVLPSSPDFLFGSNDFTIDLWFKFTSVPGAGSYQCLLSNNTSDHTTDAFQWTINPNGTSMGFGGSGVQIAGTTAFVTGTWYHLAVSKVGGTGHLFCGGVLLGSGSLDPYTYQNALTVGKRAAYGDLPCDGCMAELRISKGIGRYTTTFTPPTKVYKYPWDVA